MKKNLLKLLVVIFFVILLPVGALADCADGTCDDSVGFSLNNSNFQGPCSDGSAPGPSGCAPQSFQGPCSDGSAPGPSGCAPQSFQGPPIPISNIGDFILKIHQILNSIVPVLIALGVAFFVWGVVRYVIADSEEAKKKGKDIMIYGIIGFAVIVALWGLVFIVVDTFNLDTTAPSVTALGTGSGSACNFFNNPNRKFQDLLCYATEIINNSVIPLIFAAAVAVFVWGTVQFFIINADDDKKREQGRQFMLWGIIALAVMVSVWGLVGILGGTFNLTTSVLPHVTPPGSSP